MDNCLQPVQHALQQIPGFSHEAAVKNFYHSFLPGKRSFFHKQLARS
ncbi:hypothetical protein CSB66_2570 [Enterobacter hormaechei]|nr:hypothetical protein CSC35_0579 [Enterobacter hormaechei]RCG81754.1 hypothetical protein CSB66_2570 [Enterobacter hormaechei]